jgi:2-polyprenyl-3-methyl-5-hydroxy-6-metoxy-1,4-benzoquinol methylase
MAHLLLAHPCLLPPQRSGASLMVSTLNRCMPPWLRTFSPPAHRTPLNTRRRAPLHFPETRPPPDSRLGPCTPPPPRKARASASSPSHLPALRPPPRLPSRRTPAAWAVAIAGAEHVTGLVPVGTHTWRKFVTPQELALMAGEAAAARDGRS